MRRRAGAATAGGRGGNRALPPSSAGALIFILAAVTIVIACAAAAPVEARASSAPQRGLNKGVVIEARAGQVTVRFTQAASALYERYAHKRVWLECVVVGRNADGSFADTHAITFRVVVQRFIRAKMDRPAGGFSYCSLTRSAQFYKLRSEIVAVALSDVGRLYLDERDTAVLLFVLMDGALTADENGWRFVGSAEFAARFGGRYRVDQLVGPEASPSPGAIGYWSDGHRHAILVKVTASGKRFFVEMNDGIISTNMLAYLRYVYG